MYSACVNLPLNVQLMYESSKPTHRHNSSNRPHSCWSFNNNYYFRCLAQSRFWWSFCLSNLIVWWNRCCYCYSLPPPPKLLKYIFLSSSSQGYSSVDVSHVPNIWLFDTTLMRDLVPPADVCCCISMSTIFRTFCWKSSSPLSSVSTFYYSLSIILFIPLKKKSEVFSSIQVCTTACTS